MAMKTITIEEIVNQFSLEVLSGKNSFTKTMSKPKSRRPGLEFMDHFDFIAKEHVLILGKNEINYLHTLKDAESKLRYWQHGDL